MCKGHKFVSTVGELGNPKRCPACGPEQMAAVADKYRKHLPEAQRSNTFDTLARRPELSAIQSAAYAAACRAAQAMANGTATRPWLMLPGPAGAGKTHLAVCIANWRTEHFRETGLSPALFANIPEMLGELRESIMDDFERKIQNYMNCPLLILDDLGAERDTPFAIEQIYRIINHRYISRLPMVVTTNADRDDLDTRIRSRLNDTNMDLVTVCPMNLPDIRS